MIGRRSPFGLAPPAIPRGARMTLPGGHFFLLGFAASWVAGRYVTKGAAIVQGGAIGICGVAALMIGMPDILAEQFAWAMVALFIYGLIGALIFRSGQAAGPTGESGMNEMTAPSARPRATPPPMAARSAAW
jgi:hypothetical protein